MMDHFHLFVRRSQPLTISSHENSDVIKLLNFSSHITFTEGVLLGVFKASNLSLDENLNDLIRRQGFVFATEGESLSFTIYIPHMPHYIPNHVVSIFSLLHLFPEINLHGKYMH